MWCRSQENILIFWLHYHYRLLIGPALVIKCHSDTASYMTFDKGCEGNVSIVPVLLFWFWLHHSVRLLLGLYASAWPDNTLSLPRPFLDCHVWLTQSAATRMGVHPSLESPAVSGYIIAEPCWARRTALCACHWMWLWVRLSGGWEATVKGFLPGLQQGWQNKQNQRFGERLMWLCKNRILLFTAYIVLMNSVPCLHAWCFMYCLSKDLQGRSSAAWAADDLSIQEWYIWTNGIKQMLFLHGFKTVIQILCTDSKTKGCAEFLAHSYSQ